MKKIFLIGIGGSGLSAIARLLLESSYEVAGSDQYASPVTQALSSEGVRIFIGHRAEQVKGFDLVICSSAIPDDNPEIIAARQLGIPVQKRAAFLEDFLKGKRVIAVAGTAGKTTTTAMIAWLLTCLNLDPGYLIGGISKNLGTNSHYGKSEYFVIEADEYDRMFHGLHPAVAVITNVEHDHPDMFPDPSDYYAAFNGFIEKLLPDGKLLVGQSVPEKLDGFQQTKNNKYTYGFDQDNDYELQNVSLQPGGCYHLNLIKRIDQHPIAALNTHLCIPGEHNALNALAALAVVDLLGLSAQESAKHLEKFTGIERRFENMGTVNGITFIDDYAHHPAKIRSTLQAARATFPGRRIWAVWQPHTFSRTQTFFDDFANAFGDADQILITEVYAAREKQGDFSAVKFIPRFTKGNGVFTPDLKQAENYLAAHLQTGDVLIVLSAGDANSIIPKLMSRATKITVDALNRDGRQAGGKSATSKVNHLAMKPVSPNPSVDTLRTLFGNRLQRNVKMSRFSTAKVGGPVEFLVISKSASQLEKDVASLWDLKIPFTLLGSASNVLVSEKGLRGLVIINQARAITLHEQEDQPYIWAESGALINTIVERAGKASLSGLEWATGLPGTLGGALYGNAGAFGSEISQNLILANILHISKGRTKWTGCDLEYQYRSSILKRQPGNEVVILSAELKVEHGDHQTISDLIKTLKSRRKTQQPPGACTGSMFKNPAGEYAGRLIEEAGLKGSRRGDVEISQKHGNFFINNGNGTADDFMSLIRLTRETVAAKFGVQLELEVELLGDWNEE
ncbi:MAG: UDP-N-acetylmuramate--L-alanine ligase [Chloroflexi bacterium]|nr:UDP-N-acetylmuramate--L-alanine ligase [Chloroflexota bacterium]